MKDVKPMLLFIIFLFVQTTAFPQESIAESPVIRVLSYNILHGATTKGDFNLDKIASVINKAKPDLVALQEVDFKTNRAKGYDLATELGIRTKMAPLFGQAMPFDGGGYGEGILSKYPIVASRNVPLPHSKGNEPRCALEVLIELKSGDTISFIGTHLEHKSNNSDRIDQVQRINDIFIPNKFPSILAGDLNATPESDPIRMLKQFWTDSFGTNPEPTYSSNSPKRKIDYILYRPVSYWEVVENKVICDEIASDHCAVLSVLRLKRKK